MLNPFPDLLMFAHFAPLILRAVLGSYFVIMSVRLLRKHYSSFSIEQKLPLKAQAELWLAFSAGLSVFLGLYTQIGAVILFAVALHLSWTKRTDRMLHHALAAIAFSLLFTGAGFLAFDIPL